jgi:hypothetical protein
MKAPDAKSAAAVTGRSGAEMRTPTKTTRRTSTTPPKERPPENALVLVRPKTHARLARLLDKLKVDEVELRSRPGGLGILVRELLP